MKQLLISIFLISATPLFSQKTFLTLQTGYSTFLHGTKKYYGYSKIQSYRLSFKIETENKFRGFGIDTEFKSLGANVLFGTKRIQRLSYFGVSPYFFIRKGRLKLNSGIYFAILLKNKLKTNIIGTDIIYKRTDTGIELSPECRLTTISGKSIYVNTLVNYSLLPIYTEGKGYLIPTGKNTKNFSILFGISIRFS